MKKYIELLQIEREQLENRIRILEKRISHAPEGMLRIAHNKGVPQFYKRFVSNDTIGEYISKKKMDEIKALAQRDYDQKLLSLYLNKKRQIDRFLEGQLDAAGEERLDDREIYSSLSRDRKDLIQPLEVDDETYIRLWESVTYQGKDFGENVPELFSEKGERVRSKSEKLIADKLYMMGVPYRYEYPLQSEIGRNIYPDFTLLNVSNRKEYIWEHFGMMDNAEYCQKAIKKLNQYIRMGIYPGERLLVTYETSQMPIDMLVVKTMVEKYFL